MRAKLTIDEFIKKAKAVHGDWETKPHWHFKEHGGCVRCGIEVWALTQRSNTDEFIFKAKKIHENKYDYSLVDYEQSDTKVIIICTKHGEFEQSPNSHLAGQGCKICNGSISKVETAWLDSLNISKENRNKVIKINNRKFNVDAIDFENKKIFEFDGDFWHGNPKVFDSNDINRVAKKTFGELHEKTVNKKQFLENAGYTVISIWENEWRELCKQL